MAPQIHGACNLASYQADQSFFNEFTVELAKDAAEVNKKLLAKNIIGGFADGKKMILAVNELTSEKDMETLVLALEEILK